MLLWKSYNLAIPEMLEEELSYTCQNIIKQINLGN